MKYNFRDLIRKTSPLWLRHGNAEKLLYSIGLMFDGLTDLAIAALRCRFPGDNALFLPYHANERRIRQGKYETAEHYAVRLQSYFQAHLDRGGPYALLEQVYEYYRPNNFEVYLYYESGSYFHMLEDGTISHTIMPSTGADAWAHWILIFIWPDDIADDGTWDSPGLWDSDPPGVWDFSGITAAEVADLRLIPQEWNNAHCNGTIVLLGPSDALWDYPVEPWDSVETWDDGTAPPRIEIN